MTTRWLTPDELRAWTSFVAVVELLPRALETQLRRDSNLWHFEYYTLAMLSEVPGRTLRMTDLASRTNATLPRLSHVVSRLEARDLVRRTPCAEDRRAIDVALTEAGWEAVRQAAPGHVMAVREAVLDALTPHQVQALGEISAALLTRLDPNGAMTAPYRPPTP
ncbi:MarR family winged helix-turn-helix transcriptional regulator [Actinotalea sp. K2]|uniref:MarR family winged helix-turn-helix transcriptional regulator n=1 Tax=Actinotalea sp. K2 TaxID=2939438 RepID=UPI00201728A6|nr:MarR family transcriptional regulator [Actinotalea sp. K2]MCL3861695.1 MarR family transcriptional regulator [Actinotalea sp. K2]